MWARSSFVPPYGSRLPEVVVNVVRREQLAERHLDAVADRHIARVDVGHLDREPAAAVEVDDRERDRRTRRVRDAVDGDERDRALDLGHRRRGHVVDRIADTRDARRWEVELAAAAVARADEGVLPFLA